MTATNRRTLTERMIPLTSTEERAQWLRENAAWLAKQANARPPLTTAERDKLRAILGPVRCEGNANA